LTVISQQTLIALRMSAGGRLLAKLVTLLPFLHNISTQVNYIQCLTTAICCCGIK